jgi:hypothetical protein
MDALHRSSLHRCTRGDSFSLMEKHNLSFWLAVIGAAGVKLFTSEYTGFLRALTTVVAAVFAAYFFTTPVMTLLGLDPETYTTAMAAIMALTGEGLMRWIMGVSDSLPSDPSKIVDLFKRWTGK